jgi:hypothetical protein
MRQASFKMLLRVLGVLMARASRKNTWFRTQVNRDMTIEVTSADGVAHHYVFTRSTRQVESKPGPAPAPTVSVCFDTAGHGLRDLVDPHAVGRIVNGALDGRVVITGNAALLLWFWGLTRIVIPYGRMRRGGAPIDGALTEPNPSSSVEGQIVREPVAHELDPTWETAMAARATLTAVRSPAGEQCPMW